MANELNEVQPGDLITSDQFNALIKHVKELLAAAGGSNIVPNFFGRTLKDVLAILALPGTRLNLTSVLDATGVVVNVNDTRNASRLVIGQVPPPAARVADNAGVYLVLAAQPISSPPPPQPTISSFEPLSAPIGTEVKINGTNFDSLRTTNRVFFDGVETQAPSGQSSVHALYVIVPSGIPGAPTSSGQQKTVTVMVTTPSGLATAQLVILPPPPEPVPQLTSLGEQSVPLGGLLTVNGLNFGSTLANIRVTFDDQPKDANGNILGVQPQSSSTLPTKLIVQVPASLTGVVTGPKIVTIKVKVGSQFSANSLSVQVFKP